MLLTVTLLVEQLIYSKVVWPFRLAAIAGLTLVISLFSSTLLIENPNWAGIAVVLLSVVRLLNLFRIAKARMHSDYLRRTTARSSQVLALAQGTALLIVSGIMPISIDVSSLPEIAATIQVVAAVSLLGLTIRNLYSTRYRQGTTFYADKELPTVSLLIPARNETLDLEECLRSALASDYPKLEIIVLDDCSQAKTSQIIKDFAQDGVRFVQGDQPQDRWLAKNQAYQKLSEEASGELLLFCGVDVRFGPHAIKALVTELLQRDKQMISVLPHRLSGNVAGAFIQPMRYWWELSLPRKLFNRPPVLSTCWLIKRKTLHKLGNFKAVSHSIIPEGFFARELVKTNDYSFIRANDTLDIQTRKSYKDQRATVLRTRYPQLRRRPENVIVLVIAELTLLLGPFIGLVYGLTTDNIVGSVLSGVASLLLITNHILIVQLTSPANVIIAAFNLPIEILTEVVITLVSMVRYEFGTVEWKDRNVCIPVMHVIPRLPDLPKR